MTLIAKLEARRSQLKAQRRNPFTLLELLVVVAIIAIIAGAIIASYDGLDRKAAASTSAHSVGNLDQVMRQYHALNRTGQYNVYPNNLDSCMDATFAPIVTLPGYVSATQITDSAIPTAANLFGVSGVLEADWVTSLQRAGLGNLRTITAANNTVAILTASSVTPNQIFNTGAGQGGASVAISTTTKCLTLDNAYKTKLGIPTANNVFVFGVGSNCDLLNPAAGAGLATAPTNAAVDSQNYSRYYAVYDVGPGITFAAGVHTKARFITCIDSYGRNVDAAQADSRK